MKQTVKYYEVQGTHEEIGKALASRKEARRSYVPAPDFFTDQALEEALELYEQYCPGVCAELTSFAETLGISIKDVAYTWMSYLVPRCSGAILLGSQMKDGHTRIARNYEFSLGDEEVEICQTKAKGKYAHIGSTVAIFGRADGINECGLAVSMSSCGIPVSNFEGMRPAAVKGLQFWAVIRSLLEQCKDVEEALGQVLQMPIAFNINLYLADAKGNAVLFETINGHKAYKQISEASQEKYLCGTNHIVMPELVLHEPMAMRNSVVRYEKLEQFLSLQAPFEEAQVRSFFLKKYPEGMSLYAYPQYFGTVRTVILDTVEKRFSICWFGQEANGWEDYRVNEGMVEREEEKEVIVEQADPAIFEFIPIHR